MSEATIAPAIGSRSVAVLFAREDSNYKAMENVDAWDAARDARNWPGGSPVVAHPPCRGWGIASHFARATDEEKSHGPWAVEQVRRFGGVLEHPRGSKLWDACNLPRPHAKRDQWGYAMEIDQWWFGHPAQKPTWLYIVGVPWNRTPRIPIRLGDAERRLFNKRGLRSGQPGFRTECTRAQREHTPPAFAEWLVAVARLSNNKIRDARSAFPVSSGSHLLP